MSKTYKTGVVGAGNMGSGIAQKMAQEGLEVTLVDVKEEFVTRGLNIIKDILQQGVERNIFKPEQVEEILGRIHGTTDLNDLKDVDLVVEAIFEDEKVKGELLANLEKICKEDTVFASNTSSLFVKNIASYTTSPERVIGMHYFYHPAKNRLLEVIPHEGTNKQTIDKALLVGKLHSKTTILVKDAPGFTVNRIFIPWYVESIRIYEEGIGNIPTIDAAAKKIFGIGMGPFELMNVTGVPIALHSANTLCSELGTFYQPPKILKKLVDEKANFDLSGDVDESKVDVVRDRLLATVFGVATTMVDENVATLEDIDRGIKIGLTWKRGPFELMNKMGIDKTYDLVKDLADRRSDFEMPNILIEQKKKSVPFEFKLVDLDVGGNVAYITINRPEAMNALNSMVVDQLEQKFNEAEAINSVKAIVIQGAGKAFIAGADIKFFVENIKNDNVKATYDFTRKGHDLLLRFENSPKQTIALLDGLSLGGGSEVALACQAIIATPNGSFGFPETGIGICPGLGGMIRTERHVGPEVTKYYTFTGKNFTAQDAFDLGIVTKLVEPTEVPEAIKEIVAKGKTDKYAPRELPSKCDEIKKAFSEENVQRLLKGEAPVGVDNKLAEKLVKICSVKAPIALREANNLINAQSKVSIEEAVNLEMDKLYFMFGTKDALAGLSSPGKPPKYIGE